MFLIDPTQVRLADILEIGPFVCIPVAPATTLNETQQRLTVLSVGALIERLMGKPLAQFTADDRRDFFVRVAQARLQQRGEPATEGAVAKEIGMTRQALNHASNKKKK